MKKKEREFLIEAIHLAADKYLLDEKAILANKLQEGYSCFAIHDAITELCKGCDYMMYCYIDLIEVYTRKLGLIPWSFEEFIEFDNNLEVKQQVRYCWLKFVAQLLEENFKVD